MSWGRGEVREKLEGVTERGREGARLPGGDSGMWKGRNNQTFVFFPAPYKEYSDSKWNPGSAHLTSPPQP